MAAKKWDKERVLEALRADQRAGHDLSSAEMGRRHNGLYQACSNQFGSYAAALKALGIDPESVRKVRRWSAEKVVREIRRRYRAAEPVNSGAVQKLDPGLAGAIRAHFGCHDQALRAAGIDPLSVCEQRPWTAQQVVEELQRLNREGMDLSHTSIAQTSQSLTGAIRRHFGKHRKALEAAGIDPEPLCRQSWNRERIIEELREMAARQPGVPLTQIGIFEANPRLCNAANVHFGGPRQAVAAAGLPYTRQRRRYIRKRSHWTEEQVLELLRELHAAGEDLRYRPMKQRRQPLFIAAKELFGSYVNAVEQAGIDYWNMSQQHLHQTQLPSKPDDNPQPDATAQHKDPAMLPPRAPMLRPAAESNLTSSHQQ